MDNPGSRSLETPWSRRKLGFGVVGSAGEITYTICVVIDLSFVTTTAVVRVPLMLISVAGV